MRVPRLMAVAVGWLGLTAAVAAAGPGSGVPGSVAAHPAATGPAGLSAAALTDVAVQPGVRHVGLAQASPPTTADRETASKDAYSEPTQIQHAYNMHLLY